VAKKESHVRTTEEMNVMMEEIFGSMAEYLETTATEIRVAGKIPKESNCE
tara:strand:- start:1152 stop:1301 length:150 start_codon:yes stop_codon:yes gene_type:complete